MWQRTRLLSSCPSDYIDHDNPDQVGQDLCARKTFWTHPPVFRCSLYADMGSGIFTNITYASDPSQLRPVCFEYVELLARSECDFAEDVPIISWDEFLQQEGA